jgi:glycosyltransferase involved in cell wall biosynthesis
LLISVVIPVRNEQECIGEALARLSAVFAGLPHEAEFLVVDDGSTDATRDVLDVARAHDHRVGVVELSRAFGKEVAMSAGLEYARGDAVVIMDGDLQDPPELIPRFLDAWQQGFDVVYGVRTQRHGESALRRATASVFYRLAGLANETGIPRDAGDFRLMSRRAVDALLRIKEQHRFMKGLFSWIGFSQQPVPYERARRHAGRTKFSYWRLWNFAIEGITSSALSARARHWPTRCTW